MRPERRREHSQRLFWRKVAKCEDDKCWPWLGRANAKGYGCVGRFGRMYLAHRLAYALHHNVEVPEPGVVVRHRCDNPPCCNPAHLELGTQADNLADMHARGRAAVGEKHGQAKLTNAEAEALRIQYAAGLGSMSQLARRYGIGIRAVHAIVHGQRYKPVIVFRGER